VKIYTNSNCSGEPLAHGSAEQLASPGIGVTVLAGQTTKFWATAEAEGFVSLCSNSLAYTQGSGGLEGGGGGGSTAGKGGGGGSGTAPFKYVAPQTRITFAPASKTRSRNPVFRFLDASGQPGTKFSCKVDHHAWKRCSSPLRLKRLSRGHHTLQIKATNAIGTPEPRPVERRFKVVPR
jgi:hypothetical protein